LKVTLTAHYSRVSDTPALCGGGGRKV